MYPKILFGCYSVGKVDVLNIYPMTYDEILFQEYLVMSINTFIFVGRFEFKQYSYGTECKGGSLRSV